MNPALDLLSIVTSQYELMRKFFPEVIGLKTKQDLGTYCEFESNTIRFAITTNKVMSDATNHPSFAEERSGQSFELAFKVSSPNDVDSTYAKWVEKGATAVKPPEDMPWDQRTAFIADPDGNIHEIFAELLG